DGEEHLRLRYQRKHDAEIVRAERPFADRGRRFKAPERFLVLAGLEQDHSEVVPTPRHRRGCGAESGRAQLDGFSFQSDALFKPSWGSKREPATRVEGARHERRASTRSLEERERLVKQGERLIEAVLVTQEECRVMQSLRFDLLVPPSVLKI